MGSGIHIQIEPGAQHSDELQQIVSRYRYHFEGNPLDPTDIETESESEIDGCE